MAHLPWIYAEVLKASEELRSILLSTVRSDWSEGLPAVPLTKEESRSLVQQKHQKDEMAVLKILATLQSESTNTIIGMDIT